uniref:Ribonuclease A-domain domain-containing protein n=1 Tax=Oreochromis niloticus TaxID=8128 RepID=A0A669B892_ORENI
MKTSIFLLVALSGTVLCIADGRVQNFQNQHIISTIPPGGCDDLIANRNIRDNNGNCKRKNTFIIGNFNQVRTICDPSNRINVNRNLYESPYDMTSEEPCKYKNLDLKDKKVTIKCENGLPVHLQETKRQGF